MSNKQPPPAGKPNTSSIRITRTDLDRLKQAAKKDDRPVAWVLRKAISQFFSAQNSR